MNVMHQQRECCRSIQVQGQAIAGSIHVSLRWSKAFPAAQPVFPVAVRAACLAHPLIQTSLCPAS